jgi:peptidoglycan hydrolase-like protein with peptidoglycan-binding domain
MAQQPELAPGHTGEWVTYLQQLLTYHQAGEHFQDATYCASTETAVRDVQRRHGLAETGHCDGATWEKLTAEPQTTAGHGEDGDDQEIVIAFSTEDQVDPPGELVDLTDVHELPSHVAVS